MNALIAASAVSAYLFGFTVTGRWWVRDSREHGDPADLLTTALAALIWPVTWLIIGVVTGLGWLFGIEP